MTDLPVTAQRIELFGVAFDPLSFSGALDRLVELACGSKCAYAVTVNVDHVVRLSKQPELAPIYRSADLVLADGMPIVWASQWLGRRLPERVAGSDLFPALCERAASANLSVFLLGGSPGAADHSARILRIRHPKLRLSGTYCPAVGFERDDVECSRIANAVHKAAPDILFVGLGSPKQERWIVRYKDVCGVKLSIGVGISFSFFTGDVPRAPNWMHRLSLEWLHRLVQEPSRLWKRYLIDDLAFLPLLVYEMRRRSGRSSRTTRPTS